MFCKLLTLAKVIVWWQRIRRRRRLARGVTSEEGRYHLSYRLPDEAPGPVLLVVEVRAPELDTPLESPTTEAQPDLKIDLEAQPADRSELTALLRAIEPLLDKLPLLDVVENDQQHDISFLARETGKARRETSIH